MRCLLENAFLNPFLKEVMRKIRSNGDWNIVWRVVEYSLDDRIISETPEEGVSKRWPGC